MKFGPVGLAEAEGGLLAHGLRVGGRVLRKGTRLGRDELDALRGCGYATVTVARLESDDVSENEAARQIGHAVCGPGLGVTAASTGRVNLAATSRGLLLVDEPRIRALNRLDESITIATLPRFSNVSPRQLVATIKIIPFGVARKHLDAVAGDLSAAPVPLRLNAFRSLAVGLIQTRLPGTRDSVLDKTERVTSRRLTDLGCCLDWVARCEHSTASLSDSVGSARGAGCELVLIIGASATVDRRDVLPAAVVEAGGEVEHFGIPVDPGNLLLVGRVENMRVLGLPGSARSPRISGFDQVLWRVVARVPVGPTDLMDMGVGGLLKEIVDRPHPRVIADPAPVVDGRRPRPGPRVSAILLAAGQSRRMGTVNKLLADVHGATMVARVADEVLASKVTGVYVVTGHEDDQVREALVGRALEYAHNAAYEEGLSTSLRRGIEALPRDVDGAVVCLGDMPRVSPTVIDRLIEAFEQAPGDVICVPTFRGKRGNPVLWARRYFAYMQDLRGDVGARHLIGEFSDCVHEVPMDDDGVLTDVDTPEILEEITRG